jgi:hypothetical protein
MVGYLETRNSVSFEGRSITHPTSIFCYVCVFMGFVGRFNFFGADKEALEAGINTMLAIAINLTTKKKAKQERLPPKDNQGDEQEDGKSMKNVMDVPLKVILLFLWLCPISYTLCSCNRDDVSLCPWLDVGDILVT